MTRIQAIRRVSAALIALLAPLVSLSSASHPDILRNYRFIPSRSTLDVAGGIAGRRETFRAAGTFGLVTGYEEGVSCLAIGCPPPPTHLPFADFVDVRAWLIPEGPLTYVWNLDDTLNLSGLNGTFKDPNRLSFFGYEGQHQPFRLQATIRGPLVHLVGENDPGCCDFFKYKFNALAHLAPYADFNLDGNIDSGDYVIWRANLGTTEVANFDQGDADGDGDVDNDDWQVWRQQIGAGISLSEFSQPADSLGAIPEPASIVLLAAGFLLAANSRRRRSH